MKGTKVDDRLHTDHSLRRGGVLLWAVLLAVSMQACGPSAERIAAATRALTQAVEQGDVANAQQALDDGARVTADVIVLAAKGGDVGLFEMLADAGAAAEVGVDSRAANGETALMAASAAGHAAIVSALLAKGADVSVGHPLSSAASGGHADIVEVLLAAGAEAGGRALDAAAAGTHASLVKRLLDAGANPNAADGGGTPTGIFLRAVVEGETEIVAALLAAGADVHAEDAQGNIVTLHRIRSGMGPRIDPKNGASALVLAVWEGHADTVDALLTAGVDVNAVAEGGEPALMWAARQGHANIASALLDFGANPNAANSAGQTALALATARGHSDVVAVLRAAGATQGERPEN